MHHTGDPGSVIGDAIAKGAAIVTDRDAIGIDTPGVGIEHVAIDMGEDEERPSGSCPGHPGYDIRPSQLSPAWQAPGGARTRDGFAGTPRSASKTSISNPASPKSRATIACIAASPSLAARKSSSSSARPSARCASTASQQAHLRVARLSTSVMIWSMLRYDNRHRAMQSGCGQHYIFSKPSSRLSLFPSQSTTPSSSTLGEAIMMS